MGKDDAILSGVEGWQHLRETVQVYANAGIFILVDENTQKYCLPVVMQKCTELEQASVIILQSTESNKTILSVEQVWRKLLEGNAVRNSLLICLGGGVITDIGGFAAATFKRGMNFINVPTTLLAMVDAALGGKTGVNLDAIKNQIGVFAPPKAVYIFPEFLSTLPQKQLLSGFAEMIKHAAINSIQHLEKLSSIPSPQKGFTEMDIMESVAVKMSIVEKDPTENGIRKALNFGHTIGHAIESYSQKHDADPLLHGEAIAVGMICESFISMRLLALDDSEMLKIAELISLNFPHYKINPGSADELIGYMYHDKKSTEKDQLNFSLIRKVGEPVWDQLADEKLVRESLHFYSQLSEGYFK